MYVTTEKLANSGPSFPGDVVSRVKNWDRGPPCILWSRDLADPPENESKVIASSASET